GPGLLARVVGSVPEPQSAGPGTAPVRVGGRGDGIVGGVGVDGHGNPGSVVGHTSDGRSPGPGAPEPNGSVETDALPGAPAPIDPVTPGPPWCRSWAGHARGQRDRGPRAGAGARSHAVADSRRSRA